MKATDILRAVYGDKHEVWRDATIPGPVERWTDPAKVFANIATGLEVHDYLEVGSWLGGSALRAAEVFQRLESIACVDTWLGSAEHWTQDHPSHDLLRTHSGQPGIYGRFLANIVAAELFEKVAPIRLPSEVAAPVMARCGLAFDLIYLDGAHDYASVIRDCRAWWPLVRGVLMGDDWNDPRFGVADGVLRWLNHPKTEASPKDLRVDGNFWMVIKGG